MKAPLANLRVLRDELVRCGWVITCFPFFYKQHKYFVLVERYIPPRVAPQYQLVQLTFVDSRDASNTLTTPANGKGIAANAQEMRKFFGIDWAPNLGDLIKQFHERLGEFVPSSLPVSFAPEEQAAVIRQLDKTDSEDPRKLYCFGVRRNGHRADGTPGQRSAFNSQKTEMLRPRLYAQLKSDESISFVYSDNLEEEQTDAEILTRFVGR